MADEILTLHIKQYTDKLLDNSMLRELLTNGSYTHVDSWGWKTEVVLNDEFSFKLKYEGEDFVIQILGERKSLPLVVAHRILNFKGRLTQIRIKRNSIALVVDGLGGEHEVAALD